MSTVLTASAVSSVLTPSALSSVLTPEPIDITDGLIHRWKFEESSGTRFDSIGTWHIDGWVGSPGTTPGVAGNAIRCTVAANNHAVITSPTDFSLGNTTFTWSLWWRLNVIPATIGVALAKGFGGFQEYLLQANPSPPSSVQYTWRTRSQSEIVTEPVLRAIGSFVHVLCWHDVALNKIGLRVNGGTTVTVNKVGAITPDVAQPFGMNNGSGIHLTDSDFDSMYLWNRRLMTDEEDHMFNGGVGRDV